MIYDDDDLQLTHEQIARVESALASLRRDILPVNPARFYLMAEAYADQIRELRAEIDAYLAIPETLGHQSEVSIALEGPLVSMGHTSVGVVTRTLDTFRRGLQAIFVASEPSGDAPSAGRRKRWIEQLCDPPLAGIDAGSVRIRLGEPELGGLFSDDDLSLFRDNIAILFHGLSWAETADDAALEAAIPDEDLRHRVLSVVRNLVPPRGGTVEAIVFGGRASGMREGVRLTEQARTRLNTTLARLAHCEEYSEEVGTIREVDLDERSFILRERGDDASDLKCEYSPDAEPLVKAFLDQPVIVTGVVHRKRMTQKETMDVESIEPQITVNEIIPNLNSPVST